MYNAFRDRMKKVTIDGKGEEGWVVNRLYGLTNVYNANYMYKALIPNHSLAANGDLILYEGDKFFVISKLRSVTGTQQIQMQKVNCTVNIVRLVKEFINGTFTGKNTRVVIKENVPSVYKDITAKMQMYDAGLLQTTTRKFIIPKIADLKLLDIIEFNGELCQIDMINTTDTENLFTLQTQKDKRKIG